ncbi:MAG: hypothetical protein WB780_14590 [Candidatus Acidiferrales bacterium]
MDLVYAIVAVTARTHLVLIIVQIPAEFNSVDRGIGNTENVFVTIYNTLGTFYALTVEIAAVTGSKGVLRRFNEELSAKSEYELPCTTAAPIRSGESIRCVVVFRYH